MRVSVTCYGWTRRLLDHYNRLIEYISKVLGLRTIVFGRSLIRTTRGLGISFRDTFSQHARQTEAPLKETMFNY